MDTRRMRLAATLAALMTATLGPAAVRAESPSEGETRSTAETAHGPAHTSERRFRFALRALGTAAGEASLVIGAPETIAGVPLRPVQVVARTAGLAARFLQADSTATTWVDPGWLPVRSRWDQVIDGERRRYRSRFDASGVEGTERRGDSPEITHRHRLGRHPLDLVSLFAWLLAQPLTPRTRLQTVAFDGRRVYDLTFEVGAPRDLFLPAGQYLGLPVAVTIRRGAFRREAELWVSADSQPVPLRIAFKYGAIGSVEAVLAEVWRGSSEPSP